MKIMYRLWARFSGFVRFCSGVVAVYSYFVCVVLSPDYVFYGFWDGL